MVDLENIYKRKTMEPKLYYSRDEMKKLNIDKLEERGVTVTEIAEIAYNQQLRYNKNIDMFFLCFPSR